MIYCDILWFIMIIYDTLWSIMIYYDVQTGKSFNSKSFCNSWCVSKKFLILIYVLCFEIKTFHILSVYFYFDWIIWTCTVLLFLSCFFFFTLLELVNCKNSLHKNDGCHVYGRLHFGFGRQTRRKYSFGFDLRWRGSRWFQLSFQQR